MRQSVDLSTHGRLSDSCWPKAAELRGNLHSAKDVAQFVFGPFQHALLFLRKIFAGAVDVKVQHRHRRLIWFGFTPFATLGRAFQRDRDFSRIC